MSNYLSFLFNHLHERLWIRPLIEKIKPAATKAGATVKVLAPKVDGAELADGAMLAAGGQLAGMPSVISRRSSLTKAVMSY
ncbi:MAG: hypothetical protein R6V21_12205 [Pelovirga sp.]